MKFVPPLLISPMHEQWLRELFNTFPKPHIVVANKRGKVIAEKPTQQFVGLKQLINTGYVDANKETTPS